MDVAVVVCYLGTLLSSVLLLVSICLVWTCLCERVYRNQIGFLVTCDSNLSLYRWVLVCTGQKCLLEVFLNFHDPEFKQSHTKTVSYCQAVVRQSNFAKFWKDCHVQRRGNWFGRSETTHEIPRLRPVMNWKLLEDFQQSTEFNGQKGCCPRKTSLFLNLHLQAWMKCDELGRVKLAPISPGSLLHTAGAIWC